MQYLLPIIAVANFAAGLTLRSLDPVMPQISQQLMVSIPLVATLASASAISFAAAQLPVGALADFFGKSRLILACLVLLSVANIAGLFIHSFEWLFVTRILCGVAAGGIFPVAVGLVGDIFPIDQRRVALSRILAGSVTGQLLGAAFAGVLGDIVGWRGVLTCLGGFVLLVSVAVAWGFRDHMRAPRKAIDFSQLANNYKGIIAHRNARVCYLGAVAEGMAVFGCMPFIAAFLSDLGETRLSIAGVVIGAFPVGGLLYAATVRRMEALIGDIGILWMGGALMGSQLVAIGLDLPWQLQCLSMLLMGYGFYSMHSGLQVFTSEISVDGRATAMSMQAFMFCIGQFSGPILYGVAITYLGKFSSLLAGGMVIAAAGLVCAVLLRPRTQTSE